MYRGNFKAGETVIIPYRSQENGNPLPLISPVGVVYKAGTILNSGAGITYSIDHNGVAALNEIRIATTGAFYVAGADYYFMFTGGTKGTIPLANELVDSWSIQNRQLDNGTPGLAIRGPSVVAVPRTGSRDVVLMILVRLANGGFVDPDANTVTLTWTPADGVALPVGLPATATRVSAGVYSATFAIPSTQDKQQRFILNASGALAGATLRDYFGIQLVLSQPTSLNIND